jgi:hypothetical protein
MKYIRDDNLRQFATASQWKKLEALWTNQSLPKAGEALSIDGSGLRRACKAVYVKALARGYSPEHDLMHPSPEGMHVSKVSTLYDPDGAVKAQWVQQKPDDVQKEQAWRTLIDELVATVEPVEAVTYSMVAPNNADLCVAYPIGDHHMGLLAWGKECNGKDYDLKIAENLLNGATDYLVGAAPPAGTALIAVLGDFLHCDGAAPVTPTGGNILDMDTRFPQMIRAAIRTIRYTIDRALAKHPEVHLIIEIGNHDIYSSIFLMEALNAIYEQEPRLTVDTSPRHYHYFQFGKTLIGTHHGHGAKFADLPLIMATDVPEMWGSTDHRYIWVGHVHHKNTLGTKDYVGATVETFQVLAAQDAWHSQKGYRSKRSMKSITLHREFGEVSRNSVNPEMLKG